MQTSASSNVSWKIQREKQKLQDLMDAGLITEFEYQRAISQLIEEQESLRDLVDHWPSPLGNSLSDAFSSFKSVDSDGPVDLSNTNSSSIATREPEFKERKELLETRQRDWKSERSIRVFVSSTFRDMKEEREILSKHVFPLIRQACEEKNVSFYDVDFRWGITDEESAGGQVLLSCLNEIDKCRPFFIGILGQRYGWAQVPGGIPDKRLEITFERAIQSYPWLSHYKDRSITELEMLYGALFYPEMSPYSLFCLRDEKHLESIATSERKHYAAENDSHATMLKNLKTKIISSGLPVFNYTSPKDFGEFCLKNFLDFLGKEFPEGEQKKEKEGQWIRNYYLSSAKRLSGCFVEDIDEGKLLELYYTTKPTSTDSFSATPKNSKSSKYTKVCGPVVVSGDVGTGKTSLLSHFYFIKSTEQLQIDSAGMVKNFFFFHTIEGVDNEITTIIWRLYRDLVQHFDSQNKGKMTGSHHFVPSSSTPEELVTQFPDFVSSITSLYPDIKFSLFLDGIEKLDQQSINFYWLPKTLPVNLCLFLSISSGTEKGLKYENILQTRGWNNFLRLKPLTEERKYQVITKYFSLFGKKLSAPHSNLLAQASHTANPLYLKITMEQIRQNGVHERLTTFISDLLRSAGLESIIEYLITTWERDIGKDLVALALSLITSVPRNGLLEQELIELLKINKLTWSTLCNAIGELLVTTADGIITISNQTFLSVITKRYQPNRSSLLSKLFTYFQGQPQTRRKMELYPFLIEQMKNKSEMEVALRSLNLFRFYYNDRLKWSYFKFWEMVENKSSFCVKVSNEWLLQLEAEKSSSEKDKTVIGSKIIQFLREIGELKHACSLLENILSKKSKSSHSQKESSDEEVDMIPLPTSSDEEVTDLLYLLATLYEKLGRIKQASRVATRCYTIRASLLGKKNEKTAESMWLVALLLKKQGVYEQAIKLFQEALEIAQDKYGRYHPTVSSYMKTIADVHRKMAAFDKAEKLYLSALEICRINVGDDFHPQVGDLYDCLGRVSKKRGNYGQAKEYYVRALGICEAVFGPDHLTVAEICFNYADVERKLCNLDPAEEHYKRSILIREKALGSKHPDVAEAYHSLSLIYKMRGSYKLAEEMVNKSITVIQDAFGDQHVKRGSFLCTLGDILAAGARYQEAEQSYKTALLILEKQLGKEHPEVSEVYDSLGMIAKKTGDYGKAGQYFTLALLIVQKVYGQSHPKVAMYTHNLAQIARKQEKYDDAWELYSSSLKLSSAIYGKEHPEVAKDLNGLGLVLKKRGQYDQSWKMHEKAQRILENSLGAQHELVAVTLNYLAETLRKQGKYGIYDGTEQLYQRALEINQSVFPGERGHPEIAENLNGLATVYKYQTKYEKAEELYKRSINMTETLIGVSHPHTIHRYMNLKDLYERWGLLEKANQIQSLVKNLKVSHVN